MKDNGHERRFRDLHCRDYRHLLAYALRRTTSRPDAEDVVAGTFLVAWRRIDQLPADPHEQRLWLYGVARKVLANHRRTISRSIRLTQRVKTLRPDTAEGADAGVEDRSDIAGAFAALAHLSERDRELVTLALWEELTNAEIATVTQTSVANASVRLYRAKRRFRAHFARLVQEPPPGGHVLERRATGDQEQESTG